MLASTFSIMPCGKRIPLYVVLLFIWFFVIPHPIYCLNKSKDTPVNHGVKLFKQISLTCLNTLLNLFKQFEIFKLVKTAKPGSARTLTGLLTTNQPESIEVAMGNNNTQRVKGLPFTVCNAYVQCTAWRTSIVVYDHFSAISMMRHAACNSAVFFDGVGVASTNTATSDTPRRPLMVLLVGERSRSLANLLAGLPIPASNATSTAVKKHLHTYNGLGYVYSAPYKTGVGRRNPKFFKATPDAESVFFCVCYTCHSMAWCAHLMTNSPQAFDHATAHHAALIMVTLAGQPKGWPVSLKAGIPTPVDVTALIERRNSSGDSLNYFKEAA
ncbi:ash family protein [Salmonella enterica subsp. diarizonae]|nr:ash family protein [Salmonella enterica subsp. diarizonae]